MKKKRCSEILSWALFLPLLLILLLGLSGCGQKGEPPTDEELEAELVETEEEAETETPPTPSAPKMSEEIYIDLTARSALIWDKYKDDPDTAQREVDTLYLKAGVTWKDYKEFESKLTLQQREALQKKILEYMQKIIHEYR